MPLNVHKGYEEGLYMKGLLSEGAHNQSRKIASKQVITVLIKILFALTGFYLSFKTSL